MYLNVNEGGSEWVGLWVNEGECVCDKFGCNHACMCECTSDYVLVTVNV